MNKNLKHVFFRGPHIPGIDLKPVRENMEHFLKTDLVQPTPKETCAIDGRISLPDELLDSVKTLGRTNFLKMYTKLTRLN